MEYSGPKSFSKLPNKDSFPFACRAMLSLNRNTTDAYLRQDYGKDFKGISIWVNYTSSGHSGLSLPAFYLEYLVCMSVLVSSAAQWMLTFRLKQ